MTKAKNRPAKVRGAVLIMILAVMTVLIILLAGSIAVVYSTHERVAKKYQESQAYYTMRSTLSVCMDNVIMNTDPALSSQEVYYYTGGSDPIKKLSGSVAADQLKRGRVEELVLYQVPISTETNSASDNYNKWYADKGFTTADVSKVNIKSSDFTSMGITDPDLDNFRDQYVVKYDWGASSKVGTHDTITYTIDTQSISDMAIDSSGNKVTKMLDDSPSDTIIVKLQVLERLYDLGGSSSDSIGKQFLLGDRTKDYFKIKATCEMNIDGEKQTYSVIYSTKEPDPSNIGLSSLSKVNPGSKIKVVGEVNGLGDPTDPGYSFNFTNDSVTSSNVSFYQNKLIMPVGGGKMVLEGDKVLLVDGDIIGGDYTQGIIFAETGGTVYCKNFEGGQQPFTIVSGVTGRLVCSGYYKTKYKDGTQNLSVYADAFVFDRYENFTGPISTGPNYYNDVYIGVGNASDVDNYITVTTASGVTTVTAQPRLNSILGNSTFSGTLNFYPAGSDPFTSVFPGKSYSFDPSDSLTPTSVFAPNGTSITYKYEVATPNPYQGVKVDYDTDASFDSSTGKKQITLPDGNTVELKTQQSIFSERFLPGSWDANGDFNSTTQAYLWGQLLPRDTLPAGATAKHSTGGNGVPGIAGGTVDIPKDPTAPSGPKTAKTFNSVITKDTGLLELKGDYGGNILFDTTDGDIKVIFNDVVKGDFFVTGNNKLTIYLTSASGTFDFGGTDKRFSLIDYNTINVDSGNINMVAGKPYGPKTQIYVCDNGGTATVSQLNVWKQDGSGSVLCAQIDAPKTNFTVDSVSGGRSVTVTLPSGYTLPTISFAVMGSIFANSVQMGAERGLWSMDSPNPPGNKTVNLEERYRE